MSNKKSYNRKLHSIKKRSNEVELTGEDEEFEREIKSLIDRFMGDDHDVKDDASYQAMAIIQLFPSIIKASTDLARLVIENRARNSEQLKDEDIYEIHRTSFMKAKDMLI